MNRYFRLSILTVACMLSLTSLALAQFPVPVPQATTQSIKLQVVLSRYEGDKKISSLPYSLLLAPGESGNVRTGAEMPVPTAAFTPSGTTTSYTMQQVGSQIEATVTPTADGKFKLNLNVTDRAVVAGPTQGGVPNVPSFRNNSTNSKAILSNGETVQFISAADKAGGETFRIEVTLTVGNK
jgi:type II secretory pathway component HofQ